MSDREGGAADRRAVICPLALVGIVVTMVMGFLLPTKAFLIAAWAIVALVAIAALTAMSTTGDDQ